LFSLAQRNTNVVSLAQETGAVDPESTGLGRDDSSLSTIEDFRLEARCSVMESRIQKIRTRAEFP
jgi:hypothetical protein